MDNLSKEQAEQYAKLSVSLTSLESQQITALTSHKDLAADVVAKQNSLMRQLGDEEQARAHRRPAPAALASVCLVRPTRAFAAALAAQARKALEAVMVTKVRELHEQQQASHKLAQRAVDTGAPPPPLARARVPPRRTRGARFAAVAALSVLVRRRAQARVFAPRCSLRWTT